MRKVLLATTALVAMGGVSAASADISVSGGHEFKYQSWSGSDSTSANSNSVSNTTSYKISASSVADNGMSMTGYTAQDGSSSGGFDDYGFTISDDWGTLGFKGSESGDKFETSTDITDDEGYNGASATGVGTSGALAYHPTDSQVAASDVSYLSPDMNGFQFSVGMADTGASSDTTSFGAQYATSAGDASITIKYAGSSKGSATNSGRDGTDASSMGLVVATGGITLTVAQNDTDVTATAAANDAEYSASSMAIAYKVSDVLTVEAYTGETENDKDADFEFKDTGYGLTYTVVSGLTASVTHNSWDHKNNGGTADSGTNTAVALNLSF